MSDNVKTTLSFSTSIFTMLDNVGTTLRIWQFGKKIKCRFKNKIIFLIFKEYAGPKIFKSILRGICKRIFTEPHKFLKHRITKNIFKPFHFVKCHLVFKFKGKIQAHYDYRSFNFICIF